MQIFIMRHGEASSSAIVDSERPLVKQGEIEVAQMIKWLKSIAADFDMILVSPFKRAQQTAAALRINDTSLFSTLDFITPSGSAQKFHDYIDDICIENQQCAHGHELCILVISHMPLVSYLVAELTCDHSAPIFQTSTIAEIDYNEENRQGQLRKITSPCDLT